MVVNGVASDNHDAAVPVMHEKHTSTMMDVVAFVFGCVVLLVVVGDTVCWNRICFCGRVVERMAVALGYCCDRHRSHRDAEDSIIIAACIMYRDYSITIYEYLRIIVSIVCVWVSSYTGTY